ncbi:MAG: hypothetical protein A07HR67_02933 [uncultured archaeon A07HR67]|nr:MAG: hypothetical protein A07HR67_02933 [uncultured archaeon A07HR67]
MSWNAVDAVDDAVAATRQFLFPVSLVRWAKLSVLVLLMGGSAGTNVSVSAFQNPELFVESGGVETDPFGETTGVDLDPMVGIESVDTEGILAAAAVVVVAVVAFSIASFSLRLAYYDALHANDVRLWRPFLDRLPQAVGLFGFTTAVNLLVAIPIVVAVLAGATVGWRPADAIGSTVAGLPTWALGVLVLCSVAVVLVGLLVLRFTREFVVPVMILWDRGVLAGWRRLWPTLRGSWTEFLVYLLVHFLLGAGISLAESFVTVFLGGLVALFAGIVVLIAAGLLGGLPALTGSVAGTAFLAVVVVIALIALVLLLLPIRVVTRTYLITYEVSTLAGVDPRLAMLDSSIDPKTPDEMPG